MERNDTSQVIWNSVLDIFYREARNGIFISLQKPDHLQKDDFYFHCQFVSFRCSFSLQWFWKIWSVDSKESFFEFFFQIYLIAMRTRAALRSPLLENWNKRLTCSQCYLKFQTKPNLKNHTELVHESDLYLCPECPKYFSTTSTLNQHIENHPRNATAVRCQICPKIFMDKEKLGKHKEKKHTGLEYVSCDHCMCTFR